MEVSYRHLVQLALHRDLLQQLLHRTCQGELVDDLLQSSQGTLHRPGLLGSAGRGTSGTSGTLGTSRTLGTSGQGREGREEDGDIGSHGCLRDSGVRVRVPCRHQCPAMLKCCLSKPSENEASKKCRPCSQPCCREDSSILYL